MDDLNRGTWGIAPRHDGAKAGGGQPVSPRSRAEGRALTCRILLLRHGETTAPDRFHGCESDVGLSPRGRAQAEAAAALLVSLAPRAVYGSGLRRAVETATPIARACGLPLRTVEALHERRMGSLSGAPRDEFWHVYEEAKRHWAAFKLDYTHPGGESFDEIRDRVVPAFTALAASHADETIVVVAHGVVIRVLLCSLVEGLSPADFGSIPLDYVRIHDLRVEADTWRLAGSLVPQLTEPTEAGPW
jgi:broad specificity phosphatase PhoE